jgi:serine/threonine protein kinase
MTGRRPNDNANDAPSRKGASDKLLTSQDLFGDIVDAPIENTEPVIPTERKDPIRVQITEPVPGQPRAVRAGEKPSEMSEVAPEEVAALLEMFDAPPPAKAEPKPPPPPPKVESKARPPSPKTPPVPAAPAPAPEAEDSVNIADLDDDLPAPKARTATKFAAATPRVKPVEGPGIDLLGIAEKALDSGTPAPTPLPPTPTPSAAPASSSAAERARRVSETVYGPYRLTARIAVGGMAEVFKAKRSGVEGFEKVVAVKRILPHLSDNKEFVNMFINEAKMVAGLTHPNIVQIFDLGKIEKTYFIAMEYVHGRDLRSIVKGAKERGMRIPLDLAVLVVGKVCAALEYAHRKKDDRGRAMKIVHRDVSPQNILISYEGDVKLTDFGIAKAAARATHTDRGALRGKLLYMSPEQAAGKSMDCRSDVFSLGIVFYEMITDQRPFMATSEKSILEMVRQCQVAPPASINSRIPARLDKIVMKSLARDPDDRYQDAADMSRDLERFLHERNTPNPTAVELARFMEVLFDEADHGALAMDEPAGGSGSGEHSVSGDHRSRPIFTELEEEFEAEEGDPSEGAEEPVEPMSVQKLLKRFGLK